jgi:hypothetical protein
MKINIFSFVDRLAFSRELSDRARAEVEKIALPEKLTAATAAPTMLVNQELIWEQRPPIPEGIETPFQFFRQILS